ncbi:metal ABC transporter permease [Microcoleus sp. bin38.metabat.b11b12b14.051]|uniref:metal ABC transporter permease n=1 Tax=Microcoleus sp. bin38.metabat.b11b12b14.051 TaxID=2742709 RepID=UPI0025F5BDB0|nr:metal ABC transporter permease [Microcoleus sp. bin38.metabat.b11b12b14.051]
MLNILIEPLKFEFMRNAIAVGILLGIVCAVVGSYLIVQQMGMMVDMIAHSVLAGLPIAFYFGYNISIGAFISGIISAIIMAWIQAQSRLKIDAVMALILSTFLAISVTLISLLRTTKLDLDGFLFGNILSVAPSDVQQTLVITVIILVAVKIFYKELLFYTFDPLGAQASGLPVNLIYLGLISAITLTVVASLQTVGALLVISLLIGPGITAYLMVKELHLMMGLGAIIGIAASVTGMYLSYYFNMPSGAAIVLVVFGLFLVALLFSPSQGILTRKRGE